jgi:outer membrane biosynthesis protein TonB
MYARGYYSRPPGSFELSVRRVALLLVVAAASALGGFYGGRSLGENKATPPALAGSNVAAVSRAALSTRLRPVAAIGDLSIPQPKPPPAATTPTPTNTIPTSPTPAPAQAAPAPQPAPAPAPTPTPAPKPAPSAPSGGGSFDDSG